MNVYKPCSAAALVRSRAALRCAKDALVLLGCFDAALGCSRTALGLRGCTGVVGGCHERLWGCTGVLQGCTGCSGAALGVLWGYTGALGLHWGAPGLHRGAGISWESHVTQLETSGNRSLGISKPSVSLERGRKIRSYEIIATQAQLRSGRRSKLSIRSVI